MGKERPPDLTDTSGSGRKTQRPQVHARAEQIQTVIQTCAPGPGPQTRGSLGTFHPWKVPRPGAKYPPSAGRWGQRPLQKPRTVCAVGAACGRPAFLRCFTVGQGLCPCRGILIPPNALSSAPSSVSSSQAAYAPGQPLLPLRGNSPSRLPRHKCHGSFTSLLVLSPM